MRRSRSSSTPLSYLASVVGIRAARRPEPPVPEQHRGRLRDGLALIVRDPYLRPLTTHAAIYNGAAQIFVVNLVIWIVRDNDVSPGLYGLALAAGGAGAFVGTMLALRLAGRLGYGRAFLASLVLSCGVPLLTAALPWSGAALGAGLAALQFVACIGLGSANVLSTTLRQTRIPRDSSRARSAPTAPSTSASSRSAVPSPACWARRSAAGSPSRSARSAWPPPRCRCCPRQCADSSASTSWRPIVKSVQFTPYGVVIARLRLYGVEDVHSGGEDLGN